MNKQPKKQRRARKPQMHCPYCGSSVIFRSADGIYRDNKKHTMLYVCARYPACDSYVRVHEGTRLPMGELANREFRRLRQEAHSFFDQLYLSGLMSKDSAYLWLSMITGLPQDRAHIGYMGEYNCRLVIAESKKLLASQHIRFPKKRTKEVRTHGAYLRATAKSRTEYGAGRKGTEG